MNHSKHGRGIQKWRAMHSSAEFNAPSDTAYSLAEHYSLNTDTLILPFLQLSIDSWPQIVTI